MLHAIVFFIPMFGLIGLVVWQSFRIESQREEAERRAAKRDLSRELIGKPAPSSHANRYRAPR